MKLLPLCALLVPALPSPAVAQELPTGLPSLEQRGPSSQDLVDWALGVAGSEVIARSEIIRAMRDPYQPWGRRLQAGEEMASVTDAVLRDLALTRLEIAAGRSSGFDPALVQSLVQGHFERQVERFGGASGFSAQLQNMRMTADEFRADVTDDLYRIAWRDSQRGTQPGASGRLRADRYVRPGELLSAYEVACESSDPDQLALVGARPGGVVLQRMILELREHAQGLEGDAALDRVVLVAKQVQERVVSGDADFVDLLGSWDAMRGREAELEYDLKTLLVFSRRVHGDDSLFLWVRSAKSGEVSPPLVYRDETGATAVMLYQMQEFLEPTTPRPFVDLEVQARLRAHLLEELDQRRLSRARLNLLTRSTVHPAPLRDFLIRQEIREN